MANGPLFSIIIPTFNSAATLQSCLQSVMEQEWRDFEIILVDGLSTDDTLAIARSFNDARLRIFSEKDRGIYDAMNKGIVKAKGGWLIFLGSDDRLYSVQTLREVSLQLGDEDVVYGNVYSTRFGGLYDGEFNQSKILEKNICHQAIFFRRSLFSRTGNFDLRFESHADWDHNIKWFLDRSVKRKYIPDVISHYADGGFSSTSSDQSFVQVKSWKYHYLIRKRLGFRHKLKIARRELTLAWKQGRKSDALRIIQKLFQFLI